MVHNNKTNAFLLGWRLSITAMILAVCQWRTFALLLPHGMPVSPPSGCLRLRLRLPLRTACGHGTSSMLRGSKEEDIEKQMQIQRDILNRRRNKSKMNEYFEDVEKKRKETAVQAGKNLWFKTKDAVDPLQAWQQAKDRGEIKDIGYDAEPPKSSSVLGLNVIIPVNPIGMPKMDNGERFDLRLPYAERGYEDPDADVMGKIGSAFAGLFGKSNKSKPQSGQRDETDKNKGDKKAK